MANGKSLPSSLADLAAAESLTRPPKLPSRATELPARGAELLSRTAELLSRAAEPLSRRDAACRVSAGAIRASSRRETSAGSCSDIRCGKLVTSWNPSPTRSRAPSLCELRPSWRLRPHAPEPNQPPEYPRRGADCPRIFFVAPAWG